MKILALVITVILLLAGFMFAKDLYDDRQHQIAITSEVPLYSNPDDYVNDKNPLKVQAGEKLKVLRIKYTKDFRVVLVEREDKTEGWVIDGNGVTLTSK